MELKEGMYVRTDNGYIAKYDNSKRNCSGKYYGFASTIRDLRWEEYDDDCFLWESELKDIVKSSNNIIDLIEVGDYVNGLIVNDIVTDFDGTKTFNLFKQSSYFGNEDIKSIVTKEQFESMKYKVKE
jgi:hypothetical protein